MLTKTDIKGMPHKEWLAARRVGIGGSDAGAILGLNPYKSAFDVYADKLGLSEPKTDTEAMRQGRDLEDYVASRFEERTGKRVRRENHIIQNSAYPFALANIDRAVIGEKAGLECKTTKTLALSRYKNGEYPPEYYCQCVHYMMVTGWERWYLAVLVLGADFIVFEIERDEEEIQALADAERRFWTEHVEKKEPPAPDGSVSTDGVIGAMYTDDGGATVDLSPLDRELASLADVKKRMKEAEREKRRLEQEIKLYMRDGAEGFGGGFKVTWRKQARSSYDTSALIRDFVPEGTDLTDYYRTTEYRVFKVKELD